MLKDPILLALLALCGRHLMVSATLGDAIVIAALAAYAGFRLHIQKTTEVPINEVSKKDIEELKSAVGALKIAKTFGR